MNGLRKTLYGIKIERFRDATYVLPIHRMGDDINCDPMDFVRFRSTDARDVHNREIYDKFGVSSVTLSGENLLLESNDKIYDPKNNVDILYDPLRYCVTGYL